jgi:galactokinase
VTRVRAVGPGRVNLIGDHTDYTGGLVLPMAIDRATTVEGERGGDRVLLASSDQPDPADVALDVADPARLEPAWARYVGGVVSVVKPEMGLVGQARTSLPIGAGLSSSAALEVAVALALGAEGSPQEIALALQRAEHLATGVPTGVMDQLASLAGIDGHALLIDCSSLEVTPVEMPEGLELVVTHSGVPRGLGATAYAERRRQCEAAAAVIGPLRSASLADVEGLADPVLRRRARHVVTENARVRAFVVALADGDLSAAGALATESHTSLRDDFEVSVPELDALVAEMTATPGVLGARLTGAGFGGCVLTLCLPGTRVDGRRVRPSAGATVEVF